MNNVLTNEEMLRRAPSIFSEKASSKLTDKYSFIPTSTLVTTLGEAGWYPVKAQQSNSHNPEKLPFKKHKIQFENGLAFREVGDIVPQIHISNSHDGLNSFEFNLGLFRLVCSNGLVTAHSQFASIRIRHKGFAKEKVFAAIEEITKQIPMVLDYVERMRSVNLTQEQQVQFARNAAELRWKDKHVPVNPAELLHIRRPEDAGDSVWHVYNRVQENLIRGGMEGLSATNRPRRVRSVNALDLDYNINRGLWEMAEKLAA